VNRDVGELLAPAGEDLGQCDLDALGRGMPGPPAHRREQVRVPAQYGPQRHVVPAGVLEGVFQDGFGPVGAVHADHDASALLHAPGRSAHDDGG
jgi:hypothetical protein